MLVIGILKFNIHWLIIVAVGFALGIANIIGYTKCSKNAKQRVQSIVQDGASRGQCLHCVTMILVVASLRGSREDRIKMKHRDKHHAHNYRIG